MTQTLKAVLVGCGGISRAWLKGVQDLDDFQLAGLVDIRREAAAGRTGADLARQFGISNRAACAVINYETWIHVHE